MRFHCTEMSPQCSYFQNYSDLLTLLQCQPVTNVTIVVQVHINFNFFFWRGKTAPNYRENRVGRGKTAAAAVKQRLYIDRKPSSVSLNNYVT